MGFGIFSLMTVAGALVWCSVLAWFGAKVAKENPGLIDDPATMVHAIKSESLPIVLAVLVLGGLYFLALPPHFGPRAETPAARERGADGLYGLYGLYVDQMVKMDQMDQMDGAVSRFPTALFMTGFVFDLTKSGSQYSRR